MINLQRIDVFIEVAKQRSFAKAARRLGISGPAASKQVAMLEQELGVKLLHRTTRIVTLTDEGTLYFDRARLALDELHEAASTIQELKSMPRGTLKVNAPLSFGHMHLLPMFSGFAARYPELMLDISLEDRTIDILSEGYDVVIRIGALHDSSLVVRPLGECPIIPVASPAYLALRGTPSTPADLKKHRLITYALSTTNEWKFKDPSGKIGSIREPGAFRANTAEMMVQAALDGVGITILPLFSVATFIQSGQLVPLLDGYRTYPTRHIVALMPPNRYRSTKVRLFIDWLTAACKAIPMETTL
jgi:DNA-binding transcriptional LysR family regulator